jgi:hypothetical protein
MAKAMPAPTAKPITTLRSARQCRTVHPPAHSHTHPPGTTPDPPAHSSAPHHTPGTSSHAGRSAAAATPTPSATCCATDQPAAPRSGDGRRSRGPAPHRSPRRRSSSHTGPSGCRAGTADNPRNPAGWPRAAPATGGGLLRRGRSPDRCRVRRRTTSALRRAWFGRGTTDRAGPADGCRASDDLLRRCHRSTTAAGR